MSPEHDGLWTDHFWVEIMDLEFNKEDIGVLMDHREYIPFNKI